MFLNGGELNGYCIIGWKIFEFMIINYFLEGVDLMEYGWFFFLEIVYDGVGFGFGFLVVIDLVKVKVLS